jgi:hypothetical protein
MSSLLVTAALWWPLALLVELDELVISFARYVIEAGCAAASTFKRTARLSPAFCSCARVSTVEALYHSSIAYRFSEEA